MEQEKPKNLEDGRLFMSIIFGFVLAPIVSYSVFEESMQIPMACVMMVVFSVVIHRLMKFGHTVRVDEYEKQEAAKKAEHERHNTD